MEVENEWSPNQPIRWSASKTIVMEVGLKVYTAPGSSIVERLIFVSNYIIPHSPVILIHKAWSNMRN